MKLIVINPTRSEEAHIAEVMEEILRPVFDVISVEWTLTAGGTVVVGGIENVRARRDNHVA